MNLVSQNSVNFVFMKPIRQNFYHKCDINTPPVDYDTVIDTEITSQLCKSFDPDTFQKHGFYWISKGSDVFVTAHTSSGKTLIAEYGILKHLLAPKENRKRVIYTSPIKTLSNQKFYEFSRNLEDLNQAYSETLDSLTVGIITGDTQIRPMADLLIVTTEILRNYLYNKSEVIKNLGCVVFDEVHYLNDQERGVVWEECLILLSNKANVNSDKQNIQLILLSATIGNPLEICTWLGNLKQNTIHLITTEKRVVPLEYKIVRNGCLYDPTGCFKAEFTYKHLNPEEKVIFNFKSQKFKSNYLINNKKSDSDFRKENVFKQTKPITSFHKQLLSIVKYIESADQMPLLIFCLNKRRCTEIARKVFENRKFTHKSVEIEEFIFRSLMNTDPMILECEQLAFCVDLLKRGIAIHHSGLLPVIKEVTEMLIINGFIKLVVATETYAMGVNAPMKSVLFLSLYKSELKSSNEAKSGNEVTLEDIQNEVEIPINVKRRLLFPNEFVQMSGRAGRRNLDLKGYIYIYEDTLPGINLFKQLIGGSSKNLVSKFRLSNLMVLNVVRSKASGLFRNSFKEEVFKNFEEESLMLLKERELEYSNFGSLDPSKEELLKKLKELKEVGENLVGEGNLWEIFEDLKNFGRNLEEQNNFLELFYLKTTDGFLKNLVSEYLNFYGSKNFSSEKIQIKYSSENIQDLLNVPSFLKGALRLVHRHLLIKKEEFCETERCLNLKIEIDGLKKEVLKSQTRYFWEFEKRQGILQKQGFLQNLQKDEDLSKLNILKGDMLNGNVLKISLKGHVALELRTLPETFFVNLLMSGLFKNLKQKEFLCVVSCLLRGKEHLKMKYSEFLEFIGFQEEIEKIEDCLLKIEEARKKGLETYFSEGIEEVIPYDPCVSFFLFAWMGNLPLKTITKSFGVEEGGVSKIIMAVEEMGRELINAFEVSGIKDFEGIFKKEGLEILLRKKEVVFESLYLTSL